MPAAEDPDEGNSEGGIFEGTKFWLSHRIPERANVIALIKGHGGLVEAYDKRADILIADHARRDAPPNSFSWRLITESDKAGRFLEKEAHRIGNPPTEPRPVASQEPTRSGRVPFSAADDALLASWVSRSTQKSGNKIYQELEAAHPHHTWQSWRNRWLKHVRLLPTDVLDYMVNSSDLNGHASAAPAPNGDTATNKQQPRGQRTPPRTQQPPSVRSPQALYPPSPQEREESPGFDDNDDALLERYVKSMVEAGERWNSIAIYITLAKEHPRHSAESWKRRFAELWRDNRVNTKNWNSAAPSAHRPSSRSSNDEQRRRDGNSPRTESNELSDHDAMSHSQKSTPGTGGPKESFYRRYRAWVELEARAGRTWEVMMWHYIQGRKLALWDLYEAVLGQECPMDEVKWDVVAQNIGFGATTMVHASEELEGCWDKYLSKFHEDTTGFDLTSIVDDDDSGESTEGTDDTSEEDVSEEEAVAGDEAVFEEEGISGSEGVPTPRRTRPSPSLSHPCPGGSHRKRRLDRGVEIPASPPPKAKPGSKHGANNITPSKRRRLSPRAERQRSETDTDGDENIYDATPTRKPSMRNNANHPSPLPIRPPVDRGSGTPASDATIEQAGRANRTPGSMQTREHIRRSTATPVSNTAGRHIRSTSAAPTRTPRPHSAPKRRALPPAMAHEPEFVHKALVDDNDTDEDDNRDEVQATVEQFVREGYSQDMTVESLYRTSMIPSLSRKVLVSLARGDGVPRDQAGVWTARDDEKLRSVDTGNINRPTENLTEHRRKQELMKSLEALVGKHGKDNVEARRKFLADAKQVGLSL